MKLHRTIKRLADREEVRRAGRDVGHELPHKRILILHQFRADLAGLADSDDEFVRGYRAALLDVVAAFTAEVVVRRTTDGLTVSPSPDEWWLRDRLDQAYESQKQIPWLKERLNDILGTPCPIHTYGLEGENAKCYCTPGKPPRQRDRYC